MLSSGAWHIHPEQTRPPAVVVPAGMVIGLLAESLIDRGGGPSAIYQVLFDSERTWVRSQCGRVLACLTSDAFWQPTDLDGAVPDRLVEAEVIPTGLPLEVVALTSLDALCDWSAGNVVKQEEPFVFQIESADWGSLRVRLDDRFHFVTEVRQQGADTSLLKVVRAELLPRAEAGI